MHGPADVARRAAALAIIAAVAGCVIAPRWAEASTWVTAIGSGSTSQAKSLVVSAPGGVGSSCPAPTTSKTVKVTWTAVAHATVSVYRSTTSATSGFSLAASGVAASSWTSGALSNGSYWFEVAAVYGSSTWTSLMSTVTGPRLISSTSPVCS